MRAFKIWYSCIELDDAEAIHWRTLIASVASYLMSHNLRFFHVLHFYIIDFSHIVYASDHDSISVGDSVVHINFRILIYYTYYISEYFRRFLLLFCWKFSVKQRFFLNSFH